MWSDSAYYSRFGDWSQNRHPPSGVPNDEYGEGLQLLVECVDSGEITCLDSQNSPVAREILALHGERRFEMNSSWVGSPQDWACPCCGRTKVQLSRVGKKEQILAKCVIHHDHMSDVLEEAFNAEFVAAGTNIEQVEGRKLIDRMSSAFAAYDAILLCEDCNNADTAAKKLLGVPREFSFSIGQIRGFIQVRDHQPHAVNQSEAQIAWEAAKPAFVLRMRIIKAVAKAAATDTHWFEPYPRKFEPIPVYGHGDRCLPRISTWFSSDVLIDALGMQTRVSKANVSRWRDGSYKRGKPVPDNYLALLKSVEYKADNWDSLPDDWVCPICQRSKSQIVYVGDQGQVRFNVATTGKAWRETPKICSHCSKVHMALKAEVKSHLGNFQDSYSFVSAGELAQIILPRPHTDHQVSPTEAKALLTRILENYRPDE
jgi:rubredoxin